MISIVQGKVVLENLNGFGVERHTQQREGTYVYSFTLTWLLTHIAILLISKLEISDYYHIKRQIESEFVDGPNSKPFLDLPKVDQQLKLKERLKKYCQKAYKRVLDKPFTEVREAAICMRENPFYVDTVRR